MTGKSALRPVVEHAVRIALLSLHRAPRNIYQNSQVDDFAFR